MRTHFLVAFSVVGAVALLFAADPRPPAAEYRPPKGYVCYRATTPVTIDGKLDDAAWQAVPWTDDFVDIEGAVKPKPRFRTRVKMLWDDRYFYVGALLEEPHVWATLKEHDAVIFQDNDFEVFIDPDGDNHDYAEFEINALNTGWDLLLTKPYKDGGKAINGWEIVGLKTAVYVDGTLNDPRDTDRGWSVELALPWKALNELVKKRSAPPTDGEQWRVNFSRVEWLHEIVEGNYRKTANKSEDNWVWSPQHVIDMHRPETWGYVQFSTAKVGEAKYWPDPAGPLRHLLHRVYYAQRQHYAVHGGWAKTADDLGLREFQGMLQTTDSSFEATAVHPGSGKRWHIQSDARIWSD